MLLTTAQIKTKLFEWWWNSLFFLPGADAPLVYMRVWTLCCFHSLFSTQNLQRALTVSVDNCVEIKSAPSLASPMLAEFGGGSQKANHCSECGWFSAVFSLNILIPGHILIPRHVLIPRQLLWFQGSYCDPKAVIVHADPMQGRWPEYLYSFVCVEPGPGTLVWHGRKKPTTIPCLFCLW